MASGPPSHSGYKEEVGQTALVTRFTAAATTPPANSSPIEREALPAAGSATAVATTATPTVVALCAELHRRTSDGRIRLLNAYQWSVPDPNSPSTSLSLSVHTIFMRNPNETSLIYTTDDPKYLTVNAPTISV